MNFSEEDIHITNKVFTATINDGPSPGDRVKTPGGLGIALFGFEAKSKPGTPGCYVVRLDSANPKSLFPNSLYPIQEIEVIYE
jgi:hypothetical protein